jgi:chromosome segregation ATPase
MRSRTVTGSRTKTTAVPRPKELKAKYQELQEKRDKLTSDKALIQSSINDWQLRLGTVTRDLQDVKAAMDALDASIPDDGT